jgi:hypothetical protein
VKSIIQKLLAIAAVTFASVCSAQITSTQVWANQVAYTTGVSPVALISSADKTYTIYVKTGGSVPQEAYNVSLQTSPDNGVSWSLVMAKQIYIPKTDPIGTTYQMTVDVKATKLRLQLWSAQSNAVFPVTLSAWIVN